MAFFRERRQRIQECQQYLSARIQLAISQDNGFTARLPGVTGFEITERFHYDRYQPCFVVHATHPHYAGRARDRLPDRIEDFPVIVETSPPKRDSWKTRIARYWVRSR